MSEPFLGEIRPWACDFAPRGWAFCDGQLMAISQNTALFAIIGTLYGGDGRSTMGLPDLIGRVPMGAGAGPGLTPREPGDSGGHATVQLTADQIPQHSHDLAVLSARGTLSAPNAVSVLAASRTDPAYATGAPDTALAENALSTVQGGGQPHENRMPYQVLNFCIALQGVFPQRP